jgi:hypothetical protein
MALGALIQHTKQQNALTPTTTKHLVLILIFTNLELKHNLTKLGRGACSKHLSRNKGNQERRAKWDLPPA